jgi:hypothetical protein
MNDEFLRRMMKGGMPGMGMDRGRDRDLHKLEKMMRRGDKDDDFHHGGGTYISLNI